MHLVISISFPEDIAPEMQFLFAPEASSSATRRFDHDATTYYRKSFQTVGIFFLKSEICRYAGLLIDSVALPRWRRADQSSL